jgi:hypothetical protein
MGAGFLVMSKQKHTPLHCTFCQLLDPVVRLNWRSREKQAISAVSFWQVQIKPQPCRLFDGERETKPASADRRQAWSDLEGG